MSSSLSGRRYRRVGAALAQMWTGGNGPSHDAVNNALDFSGVDRSALPEGSKQKRVLAAMSSADEETARRLVTELVDSLRANGDFEGRDESALPRIARLRDELAEAGGALDQEGRLSWDAWAPSPDAPLPGAGPSQHHHPQQVPAPRATNLPARPSAAVLPSIEFLVAVLRRVPHAARPLVGPRRQGKVTVEIRDEYDAQDFVEYTLRLLFDDTRAEEVTPSYGGRSGRVDFLVKSDSIVVEVKVTRDGRDHKKIGEEIIVDKFRYRSHPDAKFLVAVVYDLVGNIGNPAVLEVDLSESDGPLPSTVIVVPWHPAR